MNRVLAHVVAIAAMTCAVAVGPAAAQSDRARVWLTNLSVAADPAGGGSAAARQKRVTAVRKEVADWLALNPEREADLPPPPGGIWSAAQLSAQVTLLRETI